MQSSWDVAAVLFDIDELADLLGERHRIIANNWQGASMMTLAGTDPRLAPPTSRPRRLQPRRVARRPRRPNALARRLYSAAEMIDHAADLFSDFAGIVHDNERRWRVFRRRVEQMSRPVDRLA